MADTWSTAVEEAADALGEMMLQLANGEAEHSHEDMAAAALKAGLAALMGGEPSEHRIEAGARAIRDALHPGDQGGWAALDGVEKPFWRNISRAALRASDETLLEEVKA